MLSLFKFEIIYNYMSLYVFAHIFCSHYTIIVGGPFGRHRLGAADWALQIGCRLGAGHLGVVSSNEEKTIKQAIP